MFIIGINGFKRSGKGETHLAIADILGTEANGFTNVLGVGFADKLKILGAKTLGFTDRSDQECIDLMNECKEDWVLDIRKHLSDEERTTEYKVGGNTLVLTAPDTLLQWHTLTGREYLQNLGNEARQVFGSDFWVDQVLPKPGPEDSSGPDGLEARYPGVQVLCITDLRYPNEAERVRSLGGTVWEVQRPGLSSDGHASEQPLPRGLIDATILNTGSLLQLRYEVEKALGC